MTVSMTMSVRPVSVSLSYRWYTVSEAMMSIPVSVIAIPGVIVSGIPIVTSIEAPIVAAIVAT